MGEWAVIEYERSSGRSIRLWTFPNFKEAEMFRRDRREFYGTIGLEKERGFTPAVPRISKAEMELFERIIKNPEWMSQIVNQFVG